jgi:hypothetical protein
MSDIVAVVEFSNNISSVERERNITVPLVGIPGPPGVTTLSGLEDTDLAILRNGSVLVYKTNTSKWTSTTRLDAQDVEAGEF